MAKTKPYDVIISGAGPIGLFLACELGLARASVLVLERDSKPESPWKSEPLGFRGLNTPSLEAFHRRGMLAKVADMEKRPWTLQPKPGFEYGGNFAGNMLNLNKLEVSRWKYRLPGPALVPGPTSLEKVETALTERAESLGIKILRGTGVTGITAEDDEGVTVEAGDAQSFRGRWLVGCDGGKSLIRKLANFDFVGTEAKVTGFIVQCELDYPDRLKKGFNATRNGMYIRGLPGVLYLLDFDNAAFDRTTTPSKEHLQDVLNRVTGKDDVQIVEVKQAATFTDRCKQTSQYRRGRILLAGDAAHIHSPMGAQGLNLGLGDAMNLGWKLAATLREEALGEKDFALLDSYETERHAFGAWVLDWTRAQIQTLQPDPFGYAMQALIRDLINTTDGTNLFLDRVWGLSQRYQPDDNDAHPLVGCSAPDFELADGERLGVKMQGGRGLLVDFQHDKSLEALVVGGEYESRVDYLATETKDQLGLGALLIRPDGFVAWAAEENGKPDNDAAKVALQRWFKY